MSTLNLNNGKHNEEFIFEWLTNTHVLFQKQLGLFSNQQPSNNKLLKFKFAALLFELVTDDGAMDQDFVVTILNVCTAIINQNTEEYIGKDSQRYRDFLLVLNLAPCDFAIDFYTTDSVKEAIIPDIIDPPWEPTIQLFNQHGNDAKEVNLTIETKNEFVGFISAMRKFLELTS